MSGQQIEQLIKMANQIALNFGESRDTELAAQRTGEHLQSFWTAAMREQLSAYAAGGGTGLSPAVKLLLQSESER
jgi:formate dehydrogenase subunit delta